jgi:hypothetical protein
MLIGRLEEGGREKEKRGGGKRDSGIFFLCLSQIIVLTTRV